MIPQNSTTSVRGSQKTSEGNGRNRSNMKIKQSMGKPHCACLKEKMGACDSASI